MNLNITILGVRGSGKSFFIKNKLLPVFSRKIIFDTMREYGNESDDIDGLLSSDFVFCENPDAFKQEFAEYFQIPNFSIVCQYSDVAEDNESLEFLFEAGYATVIYEEFHLACSRAKGTDYRIMTLGRHKNINMIVTAQRAQSLTSTILSQSDIIVSFKQTHPNDIRYLSQFSEAADGLRGLERGNYIILQGEDILEKILDNGKK